MKLFAFLPAAVFASLSSALAVESPLCKNTQAALSQVVADSRVTATPNGYARSFHGLDAAVQKPEIYLGFRRMSSYNVQQCAKSCDQMNSCKAFNVYAVDKTVQGSCNQILFDCALYSAPVFADMALNKGQAQNGIDITGSNGYNADKVVATTITEHQAVTRTVTTTAFFYSILTSTATSKAPSILTSAAASISPSTLNNVVPVVSKTQQTTLTDAVHVVPTTVVTATTKVAPVVIKPTSAAASIATSILNNVVPVVSKTQQTTLNNVVPVVSKTQQTTLADAVHVVPTTVATTKVPTLVGKPTQI